MLEKAFINLIHPKSFQMAQFQTSSPLGLPLRCLSRGGLGTSGSRAVSGLREAAVPGLAAARVQSRTACQGHHRGLSLLPWQRFLSSPLLQIALFELWPISAALPVRGFGCAALPACRPTHFIADDVLVADKRRDVPPFSVGLVCAISLLAVKLLSLCSRELGCKEQSCKADASAGERQQFFRTCRCSFLTGLENS